jgi:hypothetical protein
VADASVRDEDGCDVVEKNREENSCLKVSEGAGESCREDASADG